MKVARIFSAKEISTAILEGSVAQLPKTVFSQRNLTARVWESTPLHMAADAQLLHLIPAEFLTLKNLLLENDGGYTVLSRLMTADKAWLDKIPNVCDWAKAANLKKTERETLAQAIEHWYTDDAEQLEEQLKNQLRLS